MNNQKSELIKKLRGGTHGAIFSAVDQIDLHVKVSLIINLNASLKRAEICQNDELLNKIHDILTSGKYWILNPTCEIFLDETNKCVYDKKKLSDYIAKEGELEVQDLDVNSSFLELTVPISILLLNIGDIPDSVFLDSPSIEIHTFMGKIRLI